MRIRLCIIAGLILIGSSSAFARGGPGGAFAAILEGLLVIAIVGGLVAGPLCARFLHRTLWLGLASLFLVAVVVAIAFPLGGIFLGLPAIVLLAVFASAAYVARGGLFQARLAVPPSTSTDGRLQESGTASLPNVLRWIAATYLFWAVVSLANFDLLAFLAIPPAVLLFPEATVKFLPFILPPLSVALAVGVIVTALVVKGSPADRHAAPFIFNACVLLTFFASAEIFRYHLMSQSLLDHKPRHFESSSFLNSVLTYRTYFRGAHASFDEDGKTYRWSYSERKFFQVPSSKISAATQPVSAPDD